MVLKVKHSNDNSEYLPSTPEGGGWGWGCGRIVFDSERLYVSPRAYVKNYCPIYLNILHKMGWACALIFLEGDPDRNSDLMTHFPIFNI